MAAEYVQRIGARIAARRVEQGLSQVDVARALPGKVDGSQVSRWERGLHRPSDDTLERLGDILDVPVSYFMAAEATKGETPDLFPAPGANSNGDIEARLARIEESISQLQQALKAASTERVGLVDQILALLNQQSGLLDRQTQLIASLQSAADQIPNETTLQEHLSQELRDVLARTAPPPEPPDRP